MRDLGNVDRKIKRSLGVLYLLRENGLAPLESANVGKGEEQHE